MPAMNSPANPHRTVSRAAVASLRASKGLAINHKDPVARNRACPRVSGVLSTFRGGADFLVTLNTTRKASVEKDWRMPPMRVGPVVLNPIPVSMRANEQSASQAGWSFVFRNVGKTIIATPMV